MKKAAANAEMLFARALELPGGAEREAFVERESAHNAALREEVRSLLKAHDEADDYFELPSRDVGTEYSIDAAGHAKAFLRSVEGETGQGIPAFLATVPIDMRQETQERIEAGVFVRRLSSAPPPVQPMPEVLPSIPGYRLTHRLGGGSLGVVYAAEDEKLHRRVALKVLRPQRDDSVRCRLLNEARRTAAIGDPAIVTVFAVLDETDPPAIAMEWVEGYPLDQFAAQLNFEQKARLLREVARGLATAHERGLIHRDLKPDNIIVGPDMRPRILDFGIALTLEEALQQGRGFQGTPLYASPEQVRGQPLEPASDVFAFGSLMFKVLTCRTPFIGESVAEVLDAIATTPPPMLREVAVGIPEDLQAICLACLAWKSADRPRAAEVALELGRFLVGEPVRLRPKLYGDLLRRGISEHSDQARTWENQSVISREERDSLEIIHRRLLADEDHWIIDARRITLLQTLLSGGTWLAVVATVLTVWMLRDDLGAPWRWLLPTGFTLVLLGGGLLARRAREDLAAATFLAGTALAVAPCTLALLGEFGAFAHAKSGIIQLFPLVFTNQQVFAASLTALAISGLAWWRLRLTGFAWTSAALGLVSYLSLLLMFNWLELRLEIQALYCLPLTLMEPVALALERRGRVRWTLPFHLVALLALVGCLDVIAVNGPTLQMLGITGARWSYFDQERLQALSGAANGLLFLILALITQCSSSLDLRRGSKLLEVLAILHLLGPLFANALEHREAPNVRFDVSLYLAAAVLFLLLAALRSRWRMLVGGLAGCGLGSYLLVDLGLVARRPFVIALGCLGLLIALGTFFYTRQLPRMRESFGRKHPGAPPQNLRRRNLNDPPGGV
jgi:serine/threonine protein kinase